VEPYDTRDTRSGSQGYTTLGRALIDSATAPATPKETRKQLYVRNIQVLPASQHVCNTASASPAALLDDQPLLLVPRSPTNH
jgi:hypothetical protein